MEDAAFQGAFETGIFGFRNVVKVVGKSLAERGHGTIIQIGTTSALRAKEGFAHLAAAQFGLRGLVQAAAKDLRSRGVHVVFLPADGFIESEKTATYVAQAGIDKAIPQEEIAKAIQYLHEQSPRAWTHELILRPYGSEWSAPH
jgi:NAD(P)-dependent dehydrogenase (short-subunit alcohol dehydrogenase family)